MFSEDSVSSQEMRNTGLIPFNKIKCSTIKLNNCIDCQRVSVSWCDHFVPTGFDRHTSAMCTNDALHSAYVMHHISLIYLDPIEAYNVICFNHLQWVIIFFTSISYCFVLFVLKPLFSFIQFLPNLLVKPCAGHKLNSYFSFLSLLDWLLTFITLSLFIPTCYYYRPVHWTGKSPQRAL